MRPNYQPSATNKLPNPKPLAQVHTHASYEYCDEGDAFRTASYLANMKQPGARPMQACVLACHCDTQASCQQPIDILSQRRSACSTYLYGLQQT